MTDVNQSEYRPLDASLAETTKIPGQDERTTGSEQTGRNPVLDEFWITVKRVPKYLKLIANMARDPEVPSSAKAALAVGGVYVVSPVDLIPGFIPIAGQLDDLVVLMLAVRTAVKACPPEVAARHLDRAGVTRDDFDHDLKSVKDTAIWVASWGLRMTVKIAERGTRILTNYWQGRHQPPTTAG
jgi:uncharacterized membrane protein YkvA (DUF1232 family)